MRDKLSILKGTDTRRICLHDVADVFSLVVLSLIILTVVLVLITGILQDRSILDDNIMPTMILASSLLWGGGLSLGVFLLLRKYNLAWSSMGWVPMPDCHWLLWSLALTPLSVGSYLLETMLWQRLVLWLPVVRLPLLNLGAGIELSGDTATWIQVSLATVIAAIGHSLFFQGLLVQIQKASTNKAACQYANIAFMYLVLYLVGTPVGLPFTAALIITWGYRRSGALLQPIVVSTLTVLVSYVV